MLRVGNLVPDRKGHGQGAIRWAAYRTVCGWYETFQEHWLSRSLKQEWPKQAANHRRILNPPGDPAQQHQSLATNRIIPRDSRPPAVVRRIASLAPSCASFGHNSVTVRSAGALIRCPHLLPGWLLSGRLFAMPTTVTGWMCHGRPAPDRWPPNPPVRPWNRKSARRELARPLSEGSQGLSATGAAPR